MKLRRENLRMRREKDEVDTKIRSLVRRIEEKEEDAKRANVLALESEMKFAESQLLLNHYIKQGIMQSNQESEGQVDEAEIAETQLSPSLKYSQKGGCFI